MKGNVTPRWDLGPSCYTGHSLTYSFKSGGPSKLWQKKVSKAF